jgi:hypothetical protein
MEARIGLTRLLERLPGLRLSPDQGELAYTNNMVIPDLQSLRVCW